MIGIAAAGFVLAAIPLGAANVSGAGLTILAPPDGATLDRSPAQLIASSPPGALEVTLNFRKLTGVMPVRGGFAGPMDLVAGKNLLVVRSGSETRQITFEYRANDAGARPYRYHDPVVIGECNACHPKGGVKTAPATEAASCDACHDSKTGFKHLHGPLGAGQCSTCHDPHGSAFPSFLVMDARALCEQCHAQSRSQAHIVKSGNKQCQECHNPHGSAKQFLLY